VNYPFTELNLPTIRVYIVRQGAVHQDSLFHLVYCNLFSVLPPRRDLRPLVGGPEGGPKVGVYLRPPLPLEPHLRPVPFGPVDQGRPVRGRCPLEDQGVGRVYSLTPKWSKVEGIVYSNVKTLGKRGPLQGAPMSCGKG
jgi:hypothetical protein